MIRTALCAAILAASLGASSEAHEAEMALCPTGPILLRNGTIEDASGRWDDQDIYIKDGEIAAIGSDIELESARPVREIDVAGAIVRPAPLEANVLVIRTSTRANRDREPVMMMPGQMADLVVVGATGGVELEMRGGQLLGDAPACFAG